MLQKFGDASGSYVRRIIVGSDSEPPRNEGAASGSFVPVQYRSMTSGTVLKT